MIVTKFKSERSDDRELKLMSAQMDVIRSGVRSLIYARQISELKNSNNYFWVSTCNAHYGHFIESWAKCFGNYSEDTHWKKLDVYRGSFRKEMFKELDTYEGKFVAYLKEVLALRNKFFSHTDLSKDSISLDFPKLDIALDSFIFLYKVLQRRLLTAESLVVDRGPLDFKVWMSNLEEEAAKVITVAYDASKNIDEYQ
ncbi:hypothetical protein P3535_23170 [Vibrio parahaemolyticus]|uniref:hypothetical protein n=1 Tax=Vibrio parahaemolyticus TaxID=670 RepID=UPI00186996BA|nr:hypothetical protein [Vibrio parahaemolyticus]MBE4436226.1 hypothetical protein [Vibrio parahaemolyticus]MDF4815626.1 hypothetical protein [Vibrio parahaemolyticus]MDF4830438.1 hypothetical protein [Vibrio parahaemolyticus]MDF4835190.1 hypothetical protein [Vibrio parahaemolyticus]MEA5339557.1 hypothetical protein [Vibrio parahaemolyticus]